ncbi:MAG: T9SS type A sorting domain-containing protein [Chitinophagales bacterium]
MRTTFMLKHLQLFALGFIAGISFLNAQVPLSSFVGTDHLPADADLVCEIPIYPDVSTELEEPLEGELVHDFKLFTLDGDSVQLSALLNDMKPVLLIGCNYTCYVYRGKIDVVNEMKALYGDLINIFLVYTVEAHPVIDFSPYFGYENVGADNYAEGILYRQPTTYAERKAIVGDMLANMEIDVPVLIDGPCNEFWSNYGTAPNPAWLIAPDGIVFDAQKWFNKEPENMYASIDSLLGIVGTGEYDLEGTFTAVDEGEAIYYGTVENTIAAHITFTNTSIDDVLIDFNRINVDVPAGWITTLCTDLCYSPSVDSTTVFLTPGQTEIVRVDFFTDHIPASGMVEVECVNHYDPTNSFSFTINAESIAETPILDFNNADQITVAPNPSNAGEGFIINYLPESTDAIYTIYSMTGSVAATGNLRANTYNRIIVSELNNGTYLIEVNDNGKIFYSPVMVQ